MKRKRWILGVVALAALIVGCRPIPYYLEQVYKAYGKVTDVVTGQPLESVEVFVGDYQYSELTNGLGDFELEMTVGTWTVNFVLAGYEPYSEAVTLGGDVRRTKVNAALVPERPPQPSTQDVANLLSGFCSFKDTVAGAVYEEWGVISEWAIGTPDGSVALHVYPDTQTQEQTYTNYTMGTTGYTADGVLHFNLGTNPPTLSGQLVLHGGAITSLGFDLAIALDMANPSATTFAGTVTVDGWPYDVADFPAFKQDWIDLFAGEMAVYAAAQPAIDLYGTWTGTVDLGGGYIVYFEVTLNPDHSYQSLLYEVGTTILQPYSTRGTSDYLYARYAAGEPATGEMQSNISEMFDGSTWIYSPMTNTSRWVKDGELLTLSTDNNNDGTFDVSFTLHRQS